MRSDFLAIVSRFCLFLKKFYFDALQLKTTPKEVSQFFLKAIKDTMDYREKNGIKRNDFLQLVLELKNKGKLSETDETANGEAKDKDKGKHRIKHDDNMFKIWLILCFSLFRQHKNHI